VENELRADLEIILEPGIASDPLDHAKQIAAIAAILHCAFQNAGLTPTLVGGSAIEIHAPGIFASGDIDLVVEAASAGGSGSIRERAAAVFADLGFKKEGRHWTKGDLFVEVPGHSLEDPAELIHVGPFVFRVIAKEALLVDRLSGFKHWRYTGHGQQAVDMIAAFGDDLNTERLDEALKREDVRDAYEVLRKVAASREPVTEQSLRQLLSELDHP
jgi:hypothetical protein